MSVIRQALYRRGQAYAAQGDPSAAVLDLAAALAASPAAEKPPIAEKLAAARLAAGMSADTADDDDDTEQIEEVSAGFSLPARISQILCARGHDATLLSMVVNTREGSCNHLALAAMSVEIGVGS